MKRINSLLFAMLLAGMCHGQMTATFQEDVSGYTSSDAVAISDMYFGQSGNTNGITFGDGNADWCIGQLHNSPSFGYDISPLLVFRDLVLPQGAVVQSATITFRFYTWQPGGRVVGRYMNTAWSTNVIDNQGGISTPEIGWVTRMPGVDWDELGARGEGTDMVAGASFTLPDDGSTIPDMGYSTHTTFLDPTIVQQWVDNPGQNHGVKLTVDVAEVHIGVVHPRQNTTEPKPLLTINYTIGTGVDAAVPAVQVVGNAFPQPFHDRASVPVHLSRASDVSVRLIDASGRTVRAWQESGWAAGDHFIHIPGEGLGAGIYLCEVQVGEERVTQRLVRE